MKEPLHNLCWGTMGKRVGQLLKPQQVHGQRELEGPLAGAAAHHAKRSSDLAPHPLLTPHHPLSQTFHQV